MQSNRKIFTCLKCGYLWLSSMYPNRCAKCNITTWNRNIEHINPPSDDPNEEWRTIPNTESKYMLSNKGRVFSLVSNKLKSIKNNTLQLSLKRNRHLSTIFTCSLAKLLLKTFRIDLEETDYVKYKDGNSKNTSLDNLEWDNDISK